jgi:hypothetical protein
LAALFAMLQRAGLIGAEDVARLSGLARERKLSAVEAVLAAGVVDEPGLVQFLQSKLVIPRVDVTLLQRLDPETVAHLPAELAWDHTMLPVSVDEANNVTIALADPTDLRAIDAAAAHTGAYLIRAVAPLSALREAIQRYYGARPSSHERPRVRPELSSPRNVPIPDATPSAGGKAPPLSSAALADVLPRLVAADDRDAILDLLLGVLAAGFHHVIVFTHLQKQLRGRDARGPDLLRDAVTQVRIPTAGPSVFADVIAAGVPHYGPWPRDRAIDRAFSDALGGISGDVLVLPVRLREKVPVVVFASGPQYPLERRTIADLADAVSQALERLIFRRKSATDLPTVG